MEGGERMRRGPTEIDWGKLLRGGKDEVEQPGLVAVRKRKAADMAEGDDDDELAEQFRGISDKELNEKIARLQRISPVAQRMSDGGEKLRISIKRHNNELERRKRQIKDSEKCEKPVQFHDLSFFGASDGCRQETPSSVPRSGSEFATSFLKKMEEKTAHTTENVLKKELSILNCSDRQRTRSIGYHSSVGKHRGALSSRSTPFQSCSSLSTNVDKQNQLNGDQKGRFSRTPSPHHSKDALLNHFAKKRNSSRLSNDLRNHNTVVLVDEEEPEIAETTQQIDQVNECVKEARIYYPSRQDPESMEISYSDLRSLAPEAYLSSTIMNFYIRYLQQHQYLLSEQGCSYHFFNTYFYEKLKVSILKNDRETSIAKVRRWWKGVRLLEKAYIFVPINEHLHWSLVIISIPDKEDETGPIMLHLDSLGLHSSMSIFDNIRRFLIGEWEFLRKGEALPDLPMEKKLWDNLPRNIHAKTVEVPLQSNEYDCGLFVLFFIERFIEKAPQRLKKEDVAMFGRQWFQPVEASSLRQKIRNLLKEEFKKARDKNRLLDA